jgi:hypothetical protein
VEEEGEAKVKEARQVQVFPSHKQVPLIWMCPLQGSPLVMYTHP